jgi:hypothetical protein
MQARKRHLTCGQRDDADGGACVILRHLRHRMTQDDAPVTHHQTNASCETTGQKPE